MKIETHHISVPKSHRYSTYGNPSKNTKYFWFCLHGSKMRCEQVLYKFSDFDPDEHYVVAPEGMNRFYEKGFGGEVVASWMTSRDRLLEIEDFSLYLSSLYKQELSKVSGAKRICFGFSQGGTTLYRWLHNQSVELDAMIGYACWIPEDIDLKKSKTDLGKLKLLYTYGVEDPFLTEDRIKAVQSIIAKNDLEIDILAFKGGHRIEKSCLYTLWTKLAGNW